MLILAYQYSSMAKVILCPLFLIWVRWHRANLRTLGSQKTLKVARLQEWTLLTTRPPQQFILARNKPFKNTTNDWLHLTNDFSQRRKLLFFIGAEFISSLRIASFHFENQMQRTNSFSQKKWSRARLEQVQANWSNFELIEKFLVVESSRSTHRQHSSP